ncbi:hypothetical protein C6W92_12410 [Roseovarius sp. A46]|jgi:hypothetical protein|uniref:FecR family protein n=1 Tax=Roseovarius sp. A46 TaxID=2109331 RepID=UPI0010105BC1|nr:FecR domain-containing protein [Roseovarius sp. A46]RXV61218.1 hypothetical protein C6W92_12410 [Roseovarius sp. A46]
MSLKQAIAIVVMTTMPSVVTAQAVGEALDVEQTATITRDGQENALQQGQSINLGDVIRTGSSGQVQLRFRDETKIAIGSSSELVIETILFDSSDTASNFTVNAVQGAFRFFSGNSDKSAYAIRTPNATMGIRGTVFDFTVSP